jgi:hypothetical protein
LKQSGGPFGNIFQKSLLFLEYDQAKEWRLLLVLGNRVSSFGEAFGATAQQIDLIAADIV